MGLVDNDATEEHYPAYSSSTSSMGTFSTKSPYYLNDLRKYPLASRYISETVSHFLTKIKISSIFLLSVRHQSDTNKNKITIRQNENDGVPLKCLQNITIQYQNVCVTTKKERYSLLFLEHKTILCCNSSSQLLIIELYSDPAFKLILSFHFENQRNSTSKHCNPFTV